MFHSLNCLPSGGVSPSADAIVTLSSYEGLMRPFAIQMHEWCGNWGTKHCSGGSPDVEWCRANCEYYEKGDCEPVETGRSRITTPPSDGELAGIMKNREVYSETCDRSFIIESTKISREYMRLSEQVEGMIEHFKEVNTRTVEIMKREARVQEMAEELTSMPGWENDHERQGIIRNEADYVGQLKTELEIRFLAAGKLKEAYCAIVTSLFQSPTRNSGEAISLATCRFSAIIVLLPAMSSKRP